MLPCASQVSRTQQFTQPHNTGLKVDLTSVFPLCYNPHSLLCFHYLVLQAELSIMTKKTIVPNKVACYVEQFIQDLISRINYEIVHSGIRTGGMPGSMM